MIESDRELIAALEAVMQSMRELGLTTALMQSFFDVGEWLLCFEGAWILVRNDPDHPLKSNGSYLALEAHFADELG